ncbi:MAG: hypothetical protein KatS3mg118_2962 [Paracoccaceae bacterium]|nr:MAG: hypothetical protein D6686_01510 [Alphaproteobacteria bacterium]GIX15003.1 MAG: hypothetical protein KatS3mg118_2962 [Paracoccaceae bacterium]
MARIGGALTAEGARRAQGSWMVIDHVDIAARSGTMRMAIDAARGDARRALGGDEPAGWRIAALHWERSGDFVRCRAEVEALG